MYYTVISTSKQGCICEILTGGEVRVWNAHRPDRERYSMPVRGVLRHIEEYQVKFVAVRTEYTAI